MPLVVANGGVLSRFGLGGESSQALFGILPAGTGESIDPTEPLNLSAELVTLTPVELAFEEPSTSQSPVLEEMWNPPAPPPPWCGTDRIAKVRVGSRFPPPKVGVTRTLPYPFQPHSRDSSVAVPKTRPDA
ncbi:unnamed protein product [Gadus morhua 'NCC']